MGLAERPLERLACGRGGDRLQVGTLVFTFRIAPAEPAPRAAAVKDECDLQWLLDSPADSVVLSPASQTLQAAGDATPAAGSKAISAGQHLRTFFENRKRRPGAAKQKPA